MVQFDTASLKLPFQFLNLVVFALDLILEDLWVKVREFVMYVGEFGFIFSPAFHNAIELGQLAFIIPEIIKIQYNTYGLSQLFAFSRHIMGGDIRFSTSQSVDWLSNLLLN